MRTLPPPMTKPTRMTVKEYLAFEEASPFRHEYFDGAAHPMGDAVPVKKSARHGLIKGNLFAALYDSVPCSGLLLAGAATLRTEVAGTDIYRFPDILVINRGLPNDTTVCHEPQFVAEILVPEHEQYGSPDAETAYRKFDSLSEFMLIPEGAFVVDIFRRRNEWRKETFALCDAFTLDTFAVTITVEQIFRNIKRT